MQSRLCSFGSQLIALCVLPVQPVINGVGGNLVAVQASRLSTWLHLHAGGAGRLPASQPRVCLSPAATFCAGDGHARTARVLLMLVLPGHVVFTLAINYLQVLAVLTRQENPCLPQNHTVIRRTRQRL